MAARDAGLSTPSPARHGYLLERVVAGGAAESEIVGPRWRLILRARCLVVTVLALTVPWFASAQPDGQRVPILVYHRFGVTVADGMTVRSSTFEHQLQRLREQGFTVIPLRWLIAWRSGARAALPVKSIVITADDGHVSVYRDMLPLVRRYNIPVTLFIYPSAVSHASYAMTWQQLQELQRSGLFDIQSHTYWHPNFKRERRNLAPAAYLAFVRKQLVQSKSVLEQHMGHRITALAWPFGLYDEITVAQAQAAGYEAAFTIARKVATRNDPAMTVPRFLMVEPPNARWFDQILLAAQAPVGPRHAAPRPLASATAP